MNDSISAGWYDDGSGSERYWDGSGWTENVRAAGAPSPDRPVGDVAPPPSSEVTQVAPPAAPVPPAGPPVTPSAPGFPVAGGYPPQPQQFSGFPSPPAGGSKKPLIFAIVGAVVVLAIVGVVLALTLGGGDDDNNNRASNDPTSDSTSDAGDPTEAAPTEAAPTEAAPTEAAPTEVTPAPILAPEEVADTYLTTQAMGDLGAACLFQSERKQQENFATLNVTSCDEVDAAVRNSPGGELLLDLYANSTTSTTIGEVFENGAEATVEYTQVLDYTGDNDSVRETYEGKTYSGTLNLVIEGSEWKVDDDPVGTLR